MRPGPQLECHSCRFPILLQFVEHDGDERSVRCPACDDVHVWTIAGSAALPPRTIAAGGATGATGVDRSSVE